jgi:PIN domain nuclease of toxin-antitoxin system
VADINALVADTHPLLFHAAGGQRLSSKARAIFAQAEAGRALIYVPAIVIYEVGLLVRAVRINLRRPVRAFFEDLFSNPAFHEHPLDAAQAFDAEEMRFTRDPFDGLIASAARDLNLPLLTRDTAIQESGVVKTIW